MKKYLYSITFPYLFFIFQMRKQQTAEIRVHDAMTSRFVQGIKFIDYARIFTTDARFYQKNVIK